MFHLNVCHLLAMVAFTQHIDVLANDVKPQTLEYRTIACLFDR
jgi:hypothetical protein